MTTALTNGCRAGFAWTGDALDHPMTLRPSHLVYDGHSIVARVVVASIGHRAKSAKKVSSKPTIAVGRSSVTQGRITRVVHNDTSGTRLHLGELYAKDSLAEREGFEPSVPRKRDNGFRDRPVRPLRHLSAIA